jgi:predicted nuclease of predicted toxin-antitoxin system
MRFLLDVCASSRSLQKMLADSGHEVTLVSDIDPRALDEVILDLALRQANILVTEDKDFGELVFVRRLPHPCIIRFVEMRVDDQVVAMRELLEKYSSSMEQGAIVVVTKDRVRVRLPQPKPEGLS